MLRVLFLKKGIFSIDILKSSAVVVLEKDVLVRFSNMVRDFFIISVELSKVGSMSKDVENR